jgi:hypothetical protein
MASTGMIRARIIDEMMIDENNIASPTITSTVVRLVERWGNKTAINCFIFWINFI